MGWLSELWLKFAEKINGAIFSFVFFWGTLPFMYHFEKKMLDYLIRMEQTSGNHAYFVLQIMLFVVSAIVDIIWFIMPFSITSLIIHGDKADK